MPVVDRLARKAASEGEAIFEMDYEPQKYYYGLEMACMMLWASRRAASAFLLLTGISLR